MALYHQVYNANTMCDLVTNVKQEVIFTCAFAFVLALSLLISSLVF